MARLARLLRCATRGPLLPHDCRSRTHPRELEVSGAGVNVHVPRYMLKKVYRAKTSPRWRDFLTSTCGRMHINLEFAFRVIDNLLLQHRRSCASGPSQRGPNQLLVGSMSLKYEPSSEPIAGAARLDPARSLNAPTPGQLLSDDLPSLAQELRVWTQPARTQPAP